MYLIGYGTRPELIKLFPLINKFKELGIEHKTLFTGQHKDLILEFESLTHKPDFILENTMVHGQSINSLISKIVDHTGKILNEFDYKVIVQGDAASSYAVALSAFNSNREVVHLEAGLRTNNLKSPFPEEGFRKMISQISSIHLCPTEQSLQNLKNEGITKNVFLVGNTIVDSCDYILNYGNTSKALKDIIKLNQNYYICTLHRRENRDNFQKMWSQLNKISEFKKIIYIRHPSVLDSEKYLDKNITQLQPLNYQDMVYALNYSDGIISDSGGLQEEAICFEKNILICRDTSERPETIESGFGKLVSSNIIENIDFLDKENQKIKKNPYGSNVTEKIIEVLKD